MSTSPATPCHTVRVLLVDDEDGFRTSLAAMLGEDGHEVLAFHAPAEVPVATLDVTVAITDYEMPGQDGFAFADSVRALHPTVPVVMVTSCRTETIETQVALRPFLSLLLKPIDYDDIHELVHALGSGRAR
jgi:DNA-binding NtrC family response regulator